MKNLGFILLLMPLVILGPLAVDLFLPALPTMAHSLVVPSTHMQWTITVYMFSLGIGQLLLGPISDKVGRKPTLLFGLGVYLITALLTAYTNSYAVHILLRGLQGIGACAIVVATFASVTDKFDANQSGKIYSYLNGIIFCIPALAPILGYQLTQVFGWQSNFVFMAIVALPVILLTVFLFTETKVQTDIDLAKSLNLRAFVQVLGQGNFVFHAILVMLAMATIMAFVSTAPSLFVDQFALSERTFTFWFSLNASMTIVMSFVGAKLLSYFALDKVICLGMVVVGVSGALIFCYTTTANILTYMLPVIFGTSGLALLLGASIGKALAPFKQQAGLATAILGFIQMSGAATIVTLVQAMGLHGITQVSLFSLCFVPLLAIKLIKYSALKHHSEAC